MKKQIWLRPDQVQIVNCCLKFAQCKLGQTKIWADGVYVALDGCTIRQIDDVLALVNDPVRGKP